jgi:hypothetical protein
MEKVSLQIGPVLRAEVNRRVNNLASRGLKPMPLKSPENEMLLALSISKDGEIRDIQPLSKSKYAFLNKAAEDSLKKSSPLAPPPQSCLKEEICKIKWKFVVE